MMTASNDDNGRKASFEVVSTNILNLNGWSFVFAQVHAAGRSAGPFGSYPRRVPPEQSARRRFDRRQHGNVPVRQKMHVRQQVQVQSPRARPAACQVRHRATDRTRAATGFGRPTDQGQVR